MALPELPAGVAVFESRYQEEFLSASVHKTYRQLLKTRLDEYEKQVVALEGNAFPNGVPKVAAASESASGEMPPDVYGEVRELGVILDCSGSMAGVLPTLRDHIRNSFKEELAEDDYTYYKPSNLLEIKGCSLVGTGALKDNLIAKSDEDAQTGGRFQRPGLDNLSAMLGLIEHRKVEAIYWYCDLQDGESPQALETLWDALYKHKVKLIVHSNDRAPRPELARIIKESGGQLIDKVVK